MKQTLPHCGFKVDRSPSCCGPNHWLTKAGLGGIVAAVKEARTTFQRILTCTLNSVLKKIVQVLLLAIGLVIAGHTVLTPMLMVIVMITGDFLAMSLTTDTVRPSSMPNFWQVGRITMAGTILGGCFLVFCISVLAVGKFEMGFGIEALRTLFDKGGAPRSCALLSERRQAPPQAKRLVWIAK
jgi:magnesium-transporting ATPase (P-type)